MREASRGAVASALFLAVLGLYSIWRFADALPVFLPFDAEHSYLPMARRVLDEGLGFLLDPQSLRVAPLTYLWPALWDADPQLIGWAHLLLYLLCIGLVWRTANLLGGRVAGVVATLLLVGNPTLHTYFRTVYTEPLFITGLLLLLLAVTELVLQRGRPRLWVGIGAFALALTLLSRPALQALAVLALAASLAAARWPGRERPEVRAMAHRLAALLAFGLLPALLVVLKNGLAFGVWSISTGAGAALYLGLHPLTQGAEPAYVGLDFDVNGLTNSIDPRSQGDHLSAVGNALLARIATQMLWDGSVAEWARFFSRKLWWWLGYHPSTLGLTLRALRVFEFGSILAAALLLALAWRRGRGTALWRWLADAPVADAAREPLARRRLMVMGLLLAGFALSLAQMLPLLFNERYSLGILEPWLILLTGCAWAVLLRGVALRRRTAGGTTRLAAMVSAPGTLGAVLIVAGVVAVPIGAYPLARWLAGYEVVALDNLSARHFTPLLQLGPPQTDLSAAVRPLPGGTSWETLASPAALVLPIRATPNVTDPNMVMHDVWRLRFAVRSPDPQNCTHAELAVTEPFPNQAAIAPTLRIRADGRARDYLIHATYNLRPARDGYLRIAFHCPIGTQVEWLFARIERANIVQRQRFMPQPQPAR